MRPGSAPADADGTRDRLRQVAVDGARRLRSGGPDEATAQQVVDWLAETFPPRAVAVACSMADAALPRLVADRIPGVDVLFLDTGYHFPETLATRDEVARALDVRVVDVRAEQSVADQDAQYGAGLHERDPGLCCGLRKVIPLQRALSGYEAWVTGVRREESPTRAGTPLVAWDERNALVKVNPLAGWSFDELTGYATDRRVPVNLLLTHGYPSIGCAPCTSPVAAGADPRSGRWAGQAKTECGLHT